MSLVGYDYAWSKPGVAALKKANAAFVARYLATNNSKAITLAEAQELSAAGIWIVLVWETTATRMMSGYNGGVADAKAAQAQALAVGMPPSRPIYFACDFDATSTQMKTIEAYLRGAAAVLGKDRVGVYGGYAVVKYMLDVGAAAWAWQTLAWSYGHWDSRAHIYQHEQLYLAGADCDRNEAIKPDYGQWIIGGDELNDADRNWIQGELNAMEARLKDAIKVGDLASTLGHADRRTVAEILQDAAQIDADEAATIADVVIVKLTKAKSTPQG